MATTRATGPEPQTAPVDDEFLQHLYRGGELLAAGKVIEAKDFLERAHKLQPRNEKGQNLLGLAYFKLGLFDRAAEVYEMLVRENPVDPTLRINLGLVYLKTNALQRAVREFEVAVELSPDHKKAHNYLGLALAQAHEYGRAREHFIQAGSDAMAEKMSRAIAGEGYSRPPPVQPARERGFAEPEGAEGVSEQGGEPVMESPPPSEPEPSLDMMEAAPVQQEQPAAPEQVQAEPPTPPPPAPAPYPPPAPAEDDWGAQFGLDESAPSQEVASAGQAAVEASPAVVAPASVPEPYGAEGQAAQDAALSGAEGPVMVVTAPPAPAFDDIPITIEEVPVAAPVQAQEAPAIAEENLPVLPVEEVSEDGMPLLTAEPENPEDLAAIAQHEQAPAEAPPYVAPVEAVPESYPAAPMEESPEEAPYPVVPMEESPEEAPYPVVPMEEAPEVPSALPGSEAAAAPPEQATPEAPIAMEAGETGTPAAIPAGLGPIFPPQAVSAELRESEARQARAEPTLGELAPAIMLEGASPTSRFTVGTGGFTAVVGGELLTRLEGLVAFSGQLSFRPEMKRFRGRTTDKPFGDAGQRMVRASGQGMLFVEAAERRVFHAVELGEESAYFRDECVFAFEEPVMFENGRVPSDVAPDLDLVHLRGNGKVLLSMPGALRSLPVRQEAPVTVPLAHLVGWHGNLTPRVVSVLQGPSGEILKTGVELSGEGFALISLPVR